MLAERERQRLVKSWQDWRVVVAEAMDLIHDAIEGGEYEKASQIMDVITQQQAQTALNMRNILVRTGVIKGDPDE